MGEQAIDAILCTLVHPLHKETALMRSKSRINLERCGFGGNLILRPFSRIIVVGLSWVQ